MKIFMLCINSEHCMLHVLHKNINICKIQIRSERCDANGMLAEHFAAAWLHTENLKMMINSQNQQSDLENESCCFSASFVLFICSFGV